MQYLSDSTCCYYFWPHESRYYQLPLVKCEAESLVQAVFTRTTLRQTFTNVSRQDVPECTYQFPLYDGATLVDFECHVNDRVITGVVKEKEEARVEYEAAVADGRQAGLLEQSSAASDVFRTSIGNLPAGGTIVVKVSYMTELKHNTENDALRFEMPTTIAPRYGSNQGFDTGLDVLHQIGFRGSPRQTPDEQSFDWVIKIDLPGAISKVESPTHPITITLGCFDAADTELSLNRCRAEMHLPKQSGLSENFVLTISATGIGEPAAFIEIHEEYPNQRAILATLVPRFNLPSIQPEIVFVCDRSGSMDGLGASSPIELAKDALKIMLHSLPTDTKFNICSFGSSHSFFYRKSQTYSRETLREAISHVGSFAADYGGTETYQAIRSTVENRYGDIPLEVILLTDGDIWQQGELFQYINEQITASKGQIRIFPLGIGDGVSTSLIEGVARAGNGFAQMVGSGERMDGRCVRMLKAALSPHITDYRLTVHYEDGLPDEHDFEIVDMPDKEASIPFHQKVNLDHGKNSKPPVSLFDPNVDPDTVIEAPVKTVRVPMPEFAQAPAKLPTLYAFSRTTAYLLLSDNALSKRPRAIKLQGTCNGADLALEISLKNIGKGRSIHQLAARKVCQDLEEGRSWLHSAKFSGKSLSELYPSQFDSLIKQGAVDLGIKFQIMNRWCAFVATDRSQNKDLEAPQLPSATSQEEQEWTSAFSSGFAVRGGGRGGGGRGGGGRGGGGRPRTLFGNNALRTGGRGAFVNPPNWPVPYRNALLSSISERHSLRGMQPSSPSGGRKRKSTDLFGSSAAQDSSTASFRIGGRQLCQARREVPNFLVSTNESVLPDPADVSGRLQRIISMQDFGGNWSRKDAQTLANLAQQLPEVFKLDDSGSSDLWITACVIEYLEKYMGDEKEIWELVAEKAKHYLHEQAGAQASSILQRARSRLNAPVS